VADWEGEDSHDWFLRKGARSGEETAPHRPYFEVLVVSPAVRQRGRSWRRVRKLRRTAGQVRLRAVFVGSFEDAVLATILNGSLEAVMIYEGIPFVHRTTSSSA